MQTYVRMSVDGSGGALATGAVALGAAVLFVLALLRYKTA
jgi:hypothetical protein